MSTPGATFAVVTGGGTSGHVLAAVAVADALVARGHARESIHYVGTTRGVEARLLPSTGYDYSLLDVSRLATVTLDAQPGLLPQARSLDVARAGRLIRRLSPKVVVNVGGYASFPATAAAILRRVPVVVVSYDRRPGLVSKLAARRAAACAVAFEGSKLPRAELTGAPVRQEVLAVDRARDRDDARSQLDLPLDRFVVAVFGGSLGAQRLNEVVTQTVERLADRRDLVDLSRRGRAQSGRRRARSRWQPGHHVSSAWIRGPHAARLRRGRSDDDAEQGRQRSPSSPPSACLR